MTNEGLEVCVFVELLIFGLTEYAINVILKRKCQVNFPKN